MFMGPALHWLEAWNEVVADGAWGKGVKKIAEKLRTELDLEHWPAFQESFRRMCDLLLEVVPAKNILFASEMIGAVRDIDPCTGHHFDDTRRYVEALGGEIEITAVFGRRRIKLTDV